jgi:hypothetical protein
MEKSVKFRKATIKISRAKKKKIEKHKKTNPDFLKFRYI